MTKKDIDDIISIICPNDEDFEKTCISPAYLKKELEVLALEQEPILDKIRAKILEEKEYAYTDFKRYKVVCLGQKCQEAYDSPPDDDFRYGMERCIDIIDKCRAESEE